MDITIGSVLAWSPVVGADHYEARCKDNGGTEISTESVTGTSIPVSTWLTGQALGNYQFDVRSIDVNGNAGDWSAVLIGTYVAPSAPANLHFE